MISSGAAQMTSSSWVEWSQSGLYVAFVARPVSLRAKKIVSAITGTMISSISTVEMTIRLPCWRAISPAGSRTTRPQPESSGSAASGDNRRSRAKERGRLLGMMRAQGLLLHCT